MYRVILHPKVPKQLAALPKPFAQRIAKALRDLASTPRPGGAKKLVQDLYRIRVGDYRVVYAIFEAEGIVFVGKVARRTEQTYRNLESLLAAAAERIRRLEEAEQPAESKHPKRKAKRRRRKKP